MATSMKLIQDDQLRNLQRLTEVALAHLALDDLLDELLHRIVEILETDTAAILILDEEANELVARGARGLEEEVEQGVRIPVGAGFAGRVVAEKRAITIEDIDKAEVVNPILREKGLRSLLGVPLLIEGEAIGVLHVGTLERHVFTDEDIRLLELVADRAALGIQHGRAYEEERDARAEAERTAARLQNVEQVTEVALSYLSRDDLLEELLARVTAILGADTAAILILDEDANELVARAAHGLEEEVVQQVRIPVGAGFAGRVVAERRPITIEDVSRADIFNPILRERGLSSLLGVPLLVQGKALGVLHVGTLEHRRFSDEDVQLLELVSNRAALAIQHSLYERERAIAEDLQRSLLPERLPDVPGTAVAARYLPAQEDTQVGGDWYDVIPLKMGRVGIAIGDVVGHGVPAAALMGQIRSALRAYALEGHGPATVLGLLNRLVRRALPREMATLAYLVLEIETGAVTFASAGHIPPLIARPDGSTKFLDEPRSVPLGVFDFTTYEEGEEALGNGATLVLCTDGLLERRTESLSEGLERLKRLVADGPPDASELCDHILAASVPEGGGGDDVALIVVRPLPLPGGRIHLTVPADPDELGPVRRVIGRWLHVGRAGPEEAYDISVAVVEACANAIEHAYSPGEATFQVDAAFEDGQVVIRVRDTGRWRPGRGRHRGRGLEIMKSLMDEVEVTPGDDGTTVELRRKLTGADR